MSGNRKALGRGLGALLSGAQKNQAKGEDSIQSIPITSIIANPFQPRRTFSNESIQELASSISANGLLQPVVVRQVNDQYQLVHGERRFRACQSLNKETIQALVRELSDQEMLVNALIENLQREDLNPVDEALSYKQLSSEFHFTHDQIAESVGKSRSHVTNSLRLLNLPDYLQEYLQSGLLAPGGARALLAIKDNGLQKRVSSDVIVQGMNVRQIEKYVKDQISQSENKDQKKSSTKGSSSIQWIEDRLKDSGLPNSKVTERSGKLKIEFQFTGDEEVQQFLDKLGL